jgi:molybdate/tungstate transport system substrate-binding protein
LAGGGVLWAAGCLGTSDHVSVLAAGSLAAVLEDRVGGAFENQTGTGYRGSYYGSNAIMRMIEDRHAHPDVAVSADAGLLRDRLYGDHADWDVAFASNVIGLAYSPETRVGDRLERGEPWYEAVMAAEDGAFAISDPNLDPLGYRAILAFRLAEAEHDLNEFADALADAAYREPEEPRLLAGVESGNRAAAVAYRNMAVERDLPFYEFPDAYNFSNPAYASRYAAVSYTTDEGYTVVGTPIVYAATVVEGADDAGAGRAFVRFLAGAQSSLKRAGLRVDGFPQAHGDPPDGVTPE